MQPSPFHSGLLAEQCCTSITTALFNVPGVTGSAAVQMQSMRRHMRRACMAPKQKTMARTLNTLQARRRMMTLLTG